MDGGGGGIGSLHDIRVPLSEIDIPGASLNSRNPANLIIPQLKRWLQCRGVPTKGKKADLVARYAYATLYTNLALKYPAKLGIVGGNFHTI